MNKPDHQLIETNQPSEQAPVSYLLLWIFACLLLISSWFAILYKINTEHQIEVDQVYRNNANLARVFEEHTIRTIKSVDQATLFLKNQYDKVGDKIDVAGYVRDGLLNSDVFTQLGIINDHGIYTHGSQNIGTGTDVSDREHVRVHMQNDSGHLFIGQSQIGRVTQKWSMTFTRRINKSDGRFGGVVAVSLDPQYLTNFYRQIDLGKYGIVALVGEDSMIRARRQGDEVSYGQDLTGSSVMKAAFEKVNGTTVNVARIDGIKRLYSFRKVKDYPLWVFVASGEDEALAEANSRAQLYMLFGGILSLLIIGFSLAITRDILKRKHTEEKLSKASKYVRGLIEASIDPLVTISSKGKITDVNQATELVTGESRAVLIGSDFSSYFTEPDKAEAGYQKVFTDGRVKDYPLSIRHKTGSITDVLYNASLYRDASGNIEGIFAAARDINDLKRAEESSRKAFQYARSLIEASLDPLVTISPEGKITDVNQATESVTGRTRTELIGTDFSDYFTEPDKARAGYQQAFSEGKVTDYPLSIRHTSGSFTEVLYNATVYFSEQGKVEGIFAAARDVSERNRVERQLATYQLQLEEMVEKRTAELMQTEAKARFILDSSADGLYGVDANGLITFINPAGCALLGYQAEEVIGKSAHALFHHSKPDGQPYPEEECHAHSALQVGDVRRIDNEVYWRANGEVLPVMYAIHPILQDGRVTGAVTSFVDISEQRAAAEARERALLAAENLARVRREFLANMSHELRTPLHGVLGFADIGMRNYQNAEKVLNAFEKIKMTGNRLLGVINDVLDFSRIEAGKLNIELVQVSLIEIINQSVEIVREKAIAKHLDLKVDISHDFPASSICDPLRLGQILLNLLSNAVKFTEKGSVALSASMVDGMLVFVIRDSGIGMNQEQLGMLFNPFQQADGSNTRRFGGTGLGLVITKHILELMSGEIRVESELGVGSKFEFRLPYLPVHAQAAAMGAHIELPVLPAKPLAGISILVVEDEPINQAVILENLTEDGADVTLAANGKDAVDKIIREDVHFDIVLMDIQMPELNGFEATRQILQFCPNLPIICQTAHAMKEERDKCFESGMVAHITKPIDMDALVRLILEHVKYAGSGPHLTDTAPDV